MIGTILENDDLTVEVVGVVKKGDRTIVRLKYLEIRNSRTENTSKTLVEQGMGFDLDINSLKRNFRVKSAA